ncbi:hypothetical protein FF098_001295 [Parvularcula flava]|uniref:Ribosomal protein L7/L12 C-terminal domain-containing protein n=1 Tax=Aquisalinus luteolus TaxID=1566827 RepID=A0A8J3EPX3_9PROT|nr:hypothetical protein [Aquisalinus luteolus]NHK26538.1 hypothetical protein [Aquisalinus luteolus]GGH92643.1 hypothetical protein GCM10011355_02620 [Aquisalinus luteolus]
MGMFFLGVGTVIALIVLLFLTAEKKDPALVQADIDQAKGAITPDLEFELQMLLRNGRKIEAIKRVREVSGVGPYAAKQAVDSLARRIDGYSA